MLQFAIGFWCGCWFTALICHCLGVYRKGRQEKERESLEGKMSEQYEKRQTPAMNFVAPGVRVLVVDDSKLSRTVMKGMFFGTKIEITEAESGTECIALARKERFDLILLDQMMPGLDGAETFRRLREEMGEQTPPVIAVSSGIRKDGEDKYLQLGFSGCMRKPIQGKRLESLLQQLLPEEKLIRLPEGFSYEDGLVFFDGNTQAYQETLVLFSSLWKERKEMLQQFLQEENMEEYAILIHAIKGDARTLGASILAKLAYEQELEAKKGNVQAIRDSFERVVLTGEKTAAYFSAAFSE